MASLEGYLIGIRGSLIILPFILGILVYSLDPSKSILQVRFLLVRTNIRLYKEI